MLFVIPICRDKADRSDSVDTTSRAMMYLVALGGSRKGNRQTQEAGFLEGLQCLKESQVLVAGKFLATHILLSFGTGMLDVVDRRLFTFEHLDFLFIVHIVRSVARVDLVDGSRVHRCRTRRDR